MGRFKNGHFKRRRWPFYVLFATLAVFAVGLALSVSWYQAQLRPLDSNDTAQIVTIGAGASTTEIAQQLERSNLIRSATAFEWYVRINQLRDDLQAGSYSLSGAQSVSNIVATLVSGDVAVDLVTILPAQRLDQIRQSIIDAGFSANEVDVVYWASCSCRQATIG
jgi:cell division protein YceG involved in septum cleavage